MRKIIDKTSKGELWMEIMAGLPTYHVKGENGDYLVTTSASEAKKHWKKINGVP